MKPLLFLLTRTIFNGVKRALTSVRRLIGLVAFIGWYVFAFIRPFDRSEGKTLSRLSNQSFQFDFPPAQVVEAGVFTIFLFLSMFLTMGILTYRGGFRPADVDVLFPTPVNPKVVLVFRMVRDYLITLVFPLLFAVMGYRPTSAGIDIFLKNFPEYGPFAMKLVPIAWLLMAIAFVSIGYAASLFVNRSDLKSDRNSKIIIGTIMAMIVACSAQITLAFRDAPTFETFIGLTYSPLLRGVFGVGSLATMVVSGPLTNQPWQAVAGLLGLLAIIVISFQVAMSQVTWMYDQAAVRGFSTDNVKQMQKAGDTYGVYAEMARTGKLKTGRIARFFAQWTTKGARALIWKELVLTTRSGLWQFIVFIPITVLMIGSVGLASNGDSLRTAGWLYLVMLGMSVFMMSMGASTNGYLEMLRRVDLQKPLPFNSWETVLIEVVAKAIPTILISLLGMTVGLALNVQLWQHAIAGLFLAPTLAILICAVVFLVIILFPDIEDPTQRGFRGLMTMLGIALFCAPGVLVYVGMSFVAGPIPGGPMAAVINIALALVAAWFGGQQYATFNPSE